MTTQYQGDALFGPCPDGGDIEFANGAVVRSGGLSGAAYISMFGGNHLDTGEPESLQQWWGNHLESDPDKHIRGRTGTLIAGLPMSSGNLARIAEAGNQDLAWMISLGVATETFVEASIRSARFVVLTVTINTLNDSQTFVFQQNWIVGPGEPALSCTI